MKVHSITSLNQFFLSFAGDFKFHTSDLPTRHTGAHRPGPTQPARSRMLASRNNKSSHAPERPKKIFSKIHRGNDQTRTVRPEVGQRDFGSRHDHGSANQGDRGFEPLVCLTGDGKEDVWFRYREERVSLHRRSANTANPEICALRAGDVRGARVRGLGDIPFLVPTRAMYLSPRSIRGGS